MQILSTSFGLAYVRIAGFQQVAIKRTGKEKQHFVCGLYGTCRIGMKEL